MSPSTKHNKENSFTLISDHEGKSNLTLTAALLVWDTVITLFLEPGVICKQIFTVEIGMTAWSMTANGLFVVWDEMERGKNRSL